MWHFLFSIDLSISIWKFEERGTVGRGKSEGAFLLYQNKVNYSSQCFLSLDWNVGLERFLSAAGSWHGWLANVHWSTSSFVMSTVESINDARGQLKPGTMASTFSY